MILAIQNESKHFAQYFFVSEKPNLLHRKQEVLSMLKMFSRIFEFLRYSKSNNTFLVSFFPWGIGKSSEANAKWFVNLR